MTKTILLTGATDGIGFETAKVLVANGHTVLLHGRNADKLTATQDALTALNGGRVKTYRADFSDLEDVRAMATEIMADTNEIDVLINNAGVLRTGTTDTNIGIDVRFVVNTIAPYLLTQMLTPAFTDGARVVNLSSAAQAPVEIEALLGNITLDHMPAYAQSKLAITMWSRIMAERNDALNVIAVNPASLLASKMVQEGFGVAGNDLGIGADILVRAALSDEFADASGKYYDNDAKSFAAPHPDGLNDAKSIAVVDAIESVLARSSQGA